MKTNKYEPPTRTERHEPNSEGIRIDVPIYRKRIKIRSKYSFDKTSVKV